MPTGRQPSNSFNRLDAILEGSGVRSVASLLKNAEWAERLRRWCREAVSRHHLVPIAAHLAERGIDLATLDALGLPVDILQLFPLWRQGSRKGFQPESLKLTSVAAGAARPLGTLRLQLSPSSGTIPYALVLLRDLLRRLDRSVRFVVIVEPGSNLAALRRVVRDFFSESAGRRVRFVELRSASVFAQDNARPVRDSSGRPALLVPRAFARGSHRAEDELTPDEAERVLGVRVVRSRVLWEGGNILHDGHCCFVGSDTIAENMARLGLSAAETTALFSADLGAAVIVLGDLRSARFDRSRGTLVKSGQASFHIDLDVSLLGRVGPGRKPCALVADPVRGLEQLPSVMSRPSLFAGRFLPPSRAKQFIRAEYEAYAKQRHPRLLGYAATLEKLGYRVVGMPDLRIDPAENVFASTNLDFGYCNVLPGLRRGRPAVYYLPWGIPALDRAAAARFRAAGVEGVRIGTPAAANALMRLQGALHCFCGTLA